MKKVFALTAVIALLGLSVAAQAVTIATVPVGDPGNAADSHGAGYGSVAYNYSIGKYEVTAGQYTDFLNAKATVSDPYGLYNTSMWSNSYGCKIQRGGGGTVPNPYTYTVASDWANRPVNYVSYWDSLRFANWLGNGQIGRAHV
jgi:sulfatase modifying factor 1